MGKICELESLDVTDSGMQALVHQAKGDMRRALNVLQSAALAMGSSEITGDVVYRTTGQASPAEIEAILKILLNDSPQEAMSKLRQIQSERGIALQDMIEGLHEKIVTYDIGNNQLGGLIQRLAEIEWRLAKGCAD